MPAFTGRPSGIAILSGQAADHVLENIGKTFADVDHVLIHQSTGRLKEKGAAIALPAEKMNVNIETVGNTISPSILILLDELKRSETFRAERHADMDQCRQELLQPQFLHVDNTSQPQIKSRHR